MAVPVTARLSRRFYEKFGDEIVNELVDWLNQVDTTYRSELREQNEMNFARFDAKLEQRLAELKAELKVDVPLLGRYRARRATAAITVRAVKARGARGGARTPSAVRRRADS